MGEPGGESKSSVMGSVNLNNKKGNLFMTSKTYKLNVLAVASRKSPAGGGRKCMKANQMSKEWAVGALCVLGTIA